MLCGHSRVRQAPLWLVLAVFFLTASAGYAQDQPLSHPGWSFSLGAFDIIDSDKAFEAGIEYHFDSFKLWKLDLVPMVGVSATDEESYWVYGGARYDWPLGKRWVATPSFAVSLYEEGDGKDLGGVVEFRSSLEVAYRFDNGARLGLNFYHLSNARIYELNPGSESLVLFYKLGRR